MKKNDPQYRVERIVLMFERHGGEGARTRLYEKFPAETKDLLSKDVELRPGEIPALAYFASAAEWVLATSDRVIWRSGDSMNHLDYSQFDDATFDPRDVIAARGMKYLDKLVLKRKGEEVQKLDLEPGIGFAGLWNALKEMAYITSGSYESVELTLPPAVQAAGSYTEAAVELRCGSWISDCTGNGGGEEADDEGFTHEITSIDDGCIVGEPQTNLCSAGMGSFGVTRCSPRVRV